MIRYIGYGLWDKRKSLFFWILVWGGLSIILALLFDGLSAEDELEGVLENLPEALLGALNISQGYFSQVENFVAGQFLTLYTLTGGVFGVFMGVGAIRGKIESHYLQTLLSQHQSRWQIAISEVVIQIVFWLMSALLVGFLSWGIFGFFTEQESVSGQFFFFAMLGSLSIQLFGLAIGLFFGILWKAAVAQSLGSGLIAITWLLNGLKDTPGYPEVLKLFSPFYYFDVALLREEFSINWSSWWFLMMISLALASLSVWIFQSEDV